jgi:hypothetical protein
MPKYVVRMFNVYLDEYEVEAPTPDEAKDLAYAYDYAKDCPFPNEVEKYAGRVEHVTKHVYQYEEDPEVWRVAAGGAYVDVDGDEGATGEDAAQGAHQGEQDAHV